MSSKKFPAVECPTANGNHLWVEGGPRDFGRYHCARCQTCMTPTHIVSAMRAYRHTLTEVHIALTKNTLGKDELIEFITAVLTEPLKRKDA